eukprot:2681784-Rhodomonas_salina.2
MAASRAVHSRCTAANSLGQIVEVAASSETHSYSQPAVLAHASASSFSPVQKRSPVVFLKVTMSSPVGQACDSPAALVRETPPALNWAPHPGVDKSGHWSVRTQFSISPPNTCEVLYIVTVAPQSAQHPF